MKQLLWITGVLTMLCGCGGNKIEYYDLTKPEIKFEEFFDGNLVGWGIVQNWKGQVVQRFDVDMHGSWEGNNGTLKEDFTYYDGKIQKRTWKVIRKEDGTFEGTAEDILNIATGKTNGSAINWHYSMDLPVGGKTYRVKFDDWMWQMNDGVLINRSYIKKFGVTVAELTLIIQKVEKE